MDPLLIGVISACTALVASIVGPIVTLSVARRQFNATVLSANRQRWIETLRDMLAELISLLVAALVVKARWQSRWNKGRDALSFRSRKSATFPSSSPRASKWSSISERRKR